MNPDIIRYIQEQRGTYTREAIRQHLIDAGHAPEEVDAAWEAVESGQLPPPPASDAVEVRPASIGQPAAAPGAPPARRLVQSPVFWLTLVIFVILVYVLPFVVAGLLPGQAGEAGWSAFGLLWVGGLIGGILLLRANRAVGMGLVFGFVGVILLPFVVVIILLGICIVAQPFSL